MPGLAKQSQGLPGLTEIADAQKDLKLDCRLLVEKKGGQKLALDGLTIELNGEKMSRTDSLPWTEGPKSKTSSGGFGATIVSKPHFINMNGMQQVNAESAAWEVVWKKDATCGALVFGLDIPQEVSHHDVVLPSGRLFLSFAVWTPEGLAVEQAKKFEKEQYTKEIEAEKEAEKEKYRTTNNIILKAFHFRNVVVACEALDVAKTDRFKHIPKSGDIVSLPNGLIMNRQGVMWHNSDFLLGQRSVGLGTASVKQLHNKNEEVRP